MKLPIILTSVLLGSSFVSTNTNTVTANRFLTEAKKRIVTGNAKILPIGAVYLVIDKSDYELNVYDDKGWLPTYPVVFGNNSLVDRKWKVTAALRREIFTL